MVDVPFAQTELATLVYYARSLAESYFLHFRSSFLQLCKSHGVSATDLALDCVADVFARDSEGRFFELLQFASSLRVPLAEIPPDEVFLAFKSFIIRFANAQVARNHAQIDPAGARIHRNLRDNLRGSTKLKLTDDFRGYVIEPKRVDCLNARPPLPIELLTRNLLVQIDGSFTVPKLLSVLHQLLVRQTRYQRSVILFELVQLLKNHFATMRAQSESAQQEVILDDLTTHDLAALRHDVQKGIQQKIVSTYLIPGKITKEEARMLNATLEDLVGDIVENGELRASFYDYLT